MAWDGTRVWEAMAPLEGDSCSRGGFTIDASSEPLGLPNRFHTVGAPGVQQEGGFFFLSRPANSPEGRPLAGRWVTDSSLDD
jgi:hypothetical protein